MWGGGFGCGASLHRFVEMMGEGEAVSVGCFRAICLAPQLVCGCSTRAPLAFFLAWGGWRQRSVWVEALRLRETAWCGSSPIHKASLLVSVSRACSTFYTPSSYTESIRKRTHKSQNSMPVFAMIALSLLSLANALPTAAPPTFIPASACLAQSTSPLRVEFPSHDGHPVVDIPVCGHCTHDLRWGRRYGIRQALASEQQQVRAYVVLDEARQLHRVVPCERRDDACVQRHTTSPPLQSA